MGYGRRCLKIVFLNDCVIIRAHFPFSLIAQFYGMDLQIPYEDIISASVQRRFLVQKFIVLKFKSCNGEDGVEFTARDYDKVLALLQSRGMLEVRE